jgi:hypothetical protein
VEDHASSLPRGGWQVLGADLNRWQGARPGLGESLADGGGDSAVAEPSHVRRLACERAGLSGRGRSRVTCNGGGPISDRGPPFQLTLHVTAERRSAGTSRRRSVLEASDLSVEQARFPVLFPRNRGPYLLAGENRRDLRRFLTGGWLHNSKSRRFFGALFRGCTPLYDLKFGGGGVATYARRGGFDAPKGPSTHSETLFRKGGALRVTASSSHPSTRQRYTSREVLLSAVEEP